MEKSDEGKKLIPVFKGSLVKKSSIQTCEREPSDLTKSVFTAKAKFEHVGNRIEHTPKEADIPPSYYEKLSSLSSACIENDILNVSKYPRGLIKTSFSPATLADSGYCSSTPSHYKGLNLSNNSLIFDKNKLINSEPQKNLPTSRTLTATLKETTKGIKRGKQVTTKNVI